jgi:hypothetical protein
MNIHNNSIKFYNRESGHEESTEIKIARENLPGLIVQKSDKREFSEEPKSKNPNHLRNLGILAGSVLAVNSVNIKPENFSTSQLLAGNAIELGFGNEAIAKITPQKAKELAKQYKIDGKLAPEVLKAHKEKDLESIKNFSNELQKVTPLYETAQERRDKNKNWVDLLKWTGGIGFGIFGGKKLLFDPAKKFLGKFSKKNTQENTTTLEAENPNVVTQETSNATAQQTESQVIIPEVISTQIPKDPNRQTITALGERGITINEGSENSNDVFNSRIEISRFGYSLDRFLIDESLIHKIVDKVNAIPQIENSNYNSFVETIRRVMSENNVLDFVINDIIDDMKKTNGNY